MLLEALIQVAIVGFMGSLFCHMCSGRGIDRIFDPPYDAVRKRHSYVIERNRLESMRGHP